MLHTFISSRSTLGRFGILLWRSRLLYNRIISLTLIPILVLSLYSQQSSAQLVSQQQSDKQSINPLDLQSAEILREQSLLLVENGKALASIVVPNPSDVWTDKSAEWLQSYVLQATGVRLPIVSEGTKTKNTIISIGHTNLAANAHIVNNDWKWDTARMIVLDDVLYLIGRDEITSAKAPPIGNARGEALFQSNDIGMPGARGTCKAVASFLEQICGVRWLLPGKDGEYVPKLENLAVAKDLDRTIVSQFAYCLGRSLYGTDTPGSFANNFGTSIKQRTYGGHSYYSWLPTEKYFKDHPEYFALINGRRSGEGNHLCSSNPKVQEILIREIRKEFDAGYDWVQLGQEDNYTRCQCEDCEALDSYRDDLPPDWYEMYDELGFERLKNAPCERLLLLHKAIADACLKSHPDKTVHLLVYRQTLVPSKLFDSFGPNVVGEMCNINPQAIIPWKGKVRAFTAYTYWFDITLGLGMGLHTTPSQAASRIRYLVESDFIGIYQIPDTNWGLMGPVYWTIAKTMGDVKRNTDELIEEYCVRVFGNASEEMLQFFKLLYHRDVIAIERSSAAEQHLFYYPPSLCIALDKILTQAEKSADTERSQMWVKLTREHFDYLKNMSYLLTSYQAYLANSTKTNRDELISCRNDFLRYRRHVLELDKEYTDRWFPGYVQFAKFLSANGRDIYYLSEQEWRELISQDSAEVREIGFPGPGVIREPFSSIE